MVKFVRLLIYFTLQHKSFYGSQQFLPLTMACR